MIKISIIVPVYNVEKYLKRCLDSIVGQTFKEIEIILVDDGSTDSSGVICDEYSKMDKRIKVIHQNNRGLSAARNEGINIAKGKYIAFVDSDDWIRADMYEKLYEISEENNADIVQCKYLKVKDDGIEYSRENDINMYVINNIQSLYNLYNERYISTVVVWNKIYRRDIFEEIKFPEGKINEDEFVMYKLLYKAKKVVLYDDIMYYYRQRIDSITGKKFSKERLQALEAYEERMLFFKEIKEEILYKKTIKKYVELLIGHYKKSKRFISDNNEILKCIRKKFKSVFFEYIINPEVLRIRKIKACIFYINSDLYDILFEK